MILFFFQLVLFLPQDVNANESNQRCEMVPMTEQGFKLDALIEPSGIYKVKVCVDYQTPPSKDYFIGQWGAEQTNGHFAQLTITDSDQYLIKSFPEEKSFLQGKQPEDEMTDLKMKIFYFENIAFQVVTNSWKEITVPVVSYDENSYSTRYSKNKGLTQVKRLDQKTPKKSEDVDWDVEAKKVKAIEEAAKKELIGLSKHLGARKYAANDYLGALTQFKKAADLGDAEAQSLVGTMYLEGQGVQQDNAVAFKWYLKAAEQGVEHSQRLVGALYFEGRGVKQSYAQAFKWFKKAGEQGSGIAQLMVGKMYLNGQGVKQNRNEAEKWFEKASKNGYGLEKLQEMAR